MTQNQIVNIYTKERQKEPSIQKEKKGEKRKRVKERRDEKKFLANQVGC